MDTVSYSSQYTAPISAPIQKAEEIMPVTKQDTNGSDTGLPVTPLPNPGEGGSIPTFPEADTGQTPVIPLPNPGEGGSIPTFPDNSTNGFPVIPLPNPGEGGSIPTFPDNTDDGSPVIPLPNPGEGGSIPTFPNNNNPIGGTIITVFPRPIIPCYFCNTTQYGTVRFLNASANYNPFLIYINDQLVVNSLDNAEISQYGRVSAGIQTITVAGQNGYVYIQKSVTVRSGSAMTIAIINSASGLDITTIFDSACFAGSGNGCFRTCNLSYTNQNINVILNRGFLTFRNVTYKEVTNFAIVPSGVYTLQVRNTNSSLPLVTSSFSVRSNASYTAYVFNWNLSTDAIRTLVVEDRR